MTFIQTHGGFIGAAVIVIALYNVAFTAFARICAILKIQEPAWMQKAGVAGEKIAQWLSANPPTTPPAVVQQQPPSS